ncbi:DJ-1/PfpI family protein [Paenibacillus sp. GCM10027627]|uniref:DJ-1/PfpI family protein n=1 Tax=unclassified Paenibacillus TaxID=185978 RepID=UPI00362F903F
MQAWTVGILLFDGVEVLDFAGPFEVFAVTAKSRGQADVFKPFVVSTIATSGKVVTANNGLKVVADYNLTDAPWFDLLVVPGGQGTRREINNAEVLGWIQRQHEAGQWTTSVCTGALLLAKCGLLDGKRATTHWASIEKMRQDFPGVTVLENTKFVDEGPIVTSAGISAGIHMAFHMVRRLLGTETAKDTARFMEYDIQFEGDE